MLGQSTERSSFRSLWLRFRDERQHQVREFAQRADQRDPGQKGKGDAGHDVGLCPATPHPPLRRQTKGDIPASDKENPPREFVQLQELIACRKVLSARNRQVCRHLPGRNNDVPSFQCLVPYVYCSWTGEACPTMERCDTGFREPVFTPFWNGLS